MALALLAQGYTNVLVGCGETLSKVIHPEIRETWFGLADGAAALWIARDETARGPSAFEILSSVYSTDGRQVDLYTTPGTLPPNAAELEQGRYFLSGDSSALGAQALARYTAMIEALLPDPVRRSAIKFLIPHQVNLSLIQEVQARTGLGGRSHWIADRVGNMGGTSVLYAWVDALRTQSFQPGDEILLMSVGGGLSFAAQLWRAL